jgi:hypothetical protein
MSEEYKAKQNKTRIKSPQHYVVTCYSFLAGPVIFSILFHDKSAYLMLYASIEIKILSPHTKGR